MVGSEGRSPRQLVARKVLAHGRVGSSTLGRWPRGAGAGLGARAVLTRGRIGFPGTPGVGEAPADHGGTEVTEGFTAHAIRIGLPRANILAYSRKSGMGSSPNGRRMKRFAGSGGGTTGASAVGALVFGGGDERVSGLLR